VFRGPHRTCVALRAGCVEIFDRRSSGASAKAPVEAVDGEIARDGLQEDGRAVGRRGVRDVNVLQLISLCLIRLRCRQYLCADTLSEGFWTARSAIEDTWTAPTPLEQRRQSIMEFC
jgi:hypothetical protein